MRKPCFGSLMLSAPASCTLFSTSLCWSDCKPGFPDEGEDQVSVEIKVIKVERFRGGPGRGAAGGSHFSWTVVFSRLPWWIRCFTFQGPACDFTCKASSVAETERKASELIQSMHLHRLSTPGFPLPATCWRREQDQSTPIKPTSIVWGVRPGREASYSACIPAGAGGLMQSDPLTGGWW